MEKVCSKSFFEKRTKKKTQKTSVRIYPCNQQLKFERKSATGSEIVDDGQSANYHFMSSAETAKFYYCGLSRSHSITSNGAAAPRRYAFLLAFENN